jgi:hypothetical protein
MELRSTEHQSGSPCQGLAVQRNVKSRRSGGLVVVSQLCCHRDPKVTPRSPAMGTRSYKVPTAGRWPVEVETEVKDVIAARAHFNMDSRGRCITTADAADASNAGHNPPMLVQPADRAPGSGSLLSNAASTWAASASELSRKCAYTLKVVAALACPRRPDTVLTGTPAPSSLLAQVICSYSGNGLVMRYL